MANVNKLQKPEYILGILASVILAVFWLIVFTFPSFFLFNPFNDPDGVRRTELAFSTLGWILISTGVPILLFMFAQGFSRARTLLPFFALLYPISLIISQFTIYVRTGSTYAQYLLDYPVFIFTDICLPILTLFIWHDLRAKSSPNI